MFKLISLFFILISMKSYALFLFNPYVGKSSGDFNYADNKGGYTALHGGAHMAYQNEIYTLGIDMSYNQYDFAKNYLNRNQKHYKGWDWGLLAGIATQGMRIWAVANLNSIRMPQGDNGYYFGNTYKFGIGFRVAGDIFLNLEYLKNTFNESEVNNGVTTDLANNIKLEATMISISVPTYN